MDFIIFADLAHVLDCAVLISIYRPEITMTISQMSLFWFTPKRQWNMKAGYILNKKT